MNFKEYLTGKKIDPAQFKTDDRETYNTWNMLYSQMHPDSFTAQKLYLINKFRRKYHLEKIPTEQTQAPAPKKVIPKIVPRIKK